jgi:hypothetical protein
MHFASRRAAAVFAAAMVVLCSLMLTACAGLGGPRVVTLSEADITRALERQMPLERRLLEVFDVRVSAPSVRLLPESNRLATELDLGIGDRIGGRNWHAHLALDYGLRYEESDGGIHLAEVRVRQLQSDPDAPSRQSDRIAALVAEQLLEGVAIYRFKPEDLKTAQGWGVKPGAVTVTPRGVEITLAPAGR